MNSDIITLFRNLPVVQSHLLHSNFEIQISNEEKSLMRLKIETLFHTIFGSEKVEDISIDEKIYMLIKYSKTKKIKKAL